MTTSLLPNPTIRELFSGEIDRKIEEVIKVDQNDVAIVRQEIDDYILTESIERNMLKVLEGYRQSVNQPATRLPFGSRVSLELVNRLCQIRGSGR